MPCLPSALVWPYEWLIIVGWTLLGGYFFMRMLFNKYKRNPKENDDIEEEENIG